MAEDQPEQNWKKSTLNPNQEYLWELCIDLECMRPDTRLNEETQAESNVKINLNDFRKRFKQSQAAEDVEDQTLHELHYKLFLHYYRLIVRLEPNEASRQLYLISCDRFFDVQQPQQMELKEKLKYRQELTKRLIVLAEKIKHLNELDLDNAKGKILRVNANARHVEPKCETLCSNLGELSSDQELCQIVKPSEPTTGETILTEIKTLAELKIFKEKYLNKFKIHWDPEMKCFLRYPELTPNENFGKKEQANISRHSPERKLAGETFNTTNIRMRSSTPNKELSEESPNMEFTGDGISLGDACGLSIEGEFIENSMIPTSIFEKDLLTEGTYTKSTGRSSNILYPAGDSTLGSIELDESIYRSSDAEFSSTNENYNKGGIQKDTVDFGCQFVESGGMESQLDKSTNTEDIHDTDQLLDISETRPEALPEKCTLTTDLTIINMELRPETWKPGMEEELFSSTEIDKLIIEKAQISPTTQLIPEVNLELHKRNPVPLRWEHQRHIIAAPRYIIKLFKCNPAYQCSPTEPNGPSFCEQLVQFNEIMASSCPSSAVDVASIKEHLGTVLRRIKPWPSKECNAQIVKCQLKELLTPEDQCKYESLRLNLTDHGPAANHHHLSPEERLQDALHAMLGFECQQLRSSCIFKGMILRWPQYQRSISESYLLLSLALIGYFYRTLQQERLRLDQLGDSGRELWSCLHVELQLYANLLKRQQAPGHLGHSLLQVFWPTRSYFLHFQWLLRLSRGFDDRQPLLNYLQLQLHVGNDSCNRLLQSWLARGMQRLLAKISSWLLTGELPASNFFIIAHKDIKDLSQYWHSRFELIEQQLPPFLNNHLVQQQLLSTGRYQDYARKFLGIQLANSMTAAELQQQLSDAYGKPSQQLEQQQPLEQLISGLQERTSQELLLQLKPTPLELLDALHQYLLLTDVEFIRQLIKLLELALDQPADYYNTKLLNNMMRKLLCDKNRQLYVGTSESTGSHGWNRFLLSWNLPPHWLVLLGNRLAKYESLFVCLWPLNYVYYVLNERIGLQHLVFWDRINLEHCPDARQLKRILEAFIEQLKDFLHLLRSHVLDDVLASAFESLRTGCKTAKTLDDLLASHSSYLKSIESGIPHCKPTFKSQHYLTDLYNIIMQLDETQLKFREHNEGSNYCDWSCESTCNIVKDLQHKFHIGVANFLLSLYCTRDPQLEGLARKLDHNGYYEQRHMELKLVQTFRYRNTNYLKLN